MMNIKIEESFIFGKFRSFKISDSHNELQKSSFRIPQLCCELCLFDISHGVNRFLDY